MTATMPDLWDTPQSSPPAPQASKRRRANRRRVLVDGGPLSGQGMDAAQLVRSLLAEYGAALSCYRRSKCMASKSTTSGEEQRELMLGQMDAALLRMANVEAHLIRRIR